MVFDFHHKKNSNNFDLVLKKLSVSRQRLHPDWQIKGNAFSLDYWENGDHYQALYLSLHKRRLK